MRKFLSSLITFFLGGLLLLFMVSNRQPVRLGLDPFNAENPAFSLFEMPLWVALFGTLFLGYFLGAFGMWLSGRTTRKRASAQKREIRQLKEELELALSANRAEEEKRERSNVPALRVDE